MLNYISAEWYKLRHTRGIFIAFGLLMVLVSTLFIPAFWYPMPTMEVYASAYLVALVLGFFLAPIFAIRAFDDQYGRGTMKNEVVFGIPRRRIYLGKLAFGALVGTVAALLVLILYLALCCLAGGLREEHFPQYLDLCIQGTFMVFPLWLAGLSLAFFLQVAIKSNTGAAVLNYLILLFGLPLSMVGFGGTAYDSPVNYFFDRLFFVAPFRELYGAIDIGLGPLSGMAYSWLVGMGWVVVTTLAGLLTFSRKEIN